MEQIKENIKTEIENLYLSEGYNHVATVPVLIPWFQCYVKCTCKKEQPMTPLDSIVCKCIRREINTAEDIAFVLALDERIVDGEMDRLKQSGMIADIQGQMKLTAKGEEAFLKNSMEAAYEKDFEVYMNGISGQYLYGDINTVADMHKDNGLMHKIEPIKTVIGSDIENNAEIREQIEQEAALHIVSMKLQSYKTVVYQKEDLIVYKKEEEKNILFALYNPVKKSLDLKPASALTKKYSRRELMTLLNIEKIVQENERHILENSPVIAGYPKKTGTHRYYRNQEIRELFKSIFDTAQKSVYIVSPWIDNNGYVMTQALLDKMENALAKRNLSITIGYGYISEEKMQDKRRRYSRNHDDTAMRRDKDWQTELMAEKLKKRFARYENFSMTYIGTHEKVLCIDERYTLVGSYNLLSYDGGEKEMFQGYHFRFEGGVMIDDAEFAKHVIKEIGM